MSSLSCASSARVGVALGSKRAIRGSARVARASARASKRASKRVNLTTRAVKEVAGAEFKAEVLESDVPVLVDFWATWCGPCKLISKVVEKAEAEYDAAKLKIVKIEVDPNPDLVEEFGVYGLPTVMLFKDGKAVEGSKREGAINLPKLKDHLEKFGVAQP